MTAIALLMLVLSATRMSIAAESEATTAADENIEELVVTSRRRGEPLARHAGNVSRLAADEISAIAHQHIHELMTRISGAWLVRASGQEHLTAIRSPVLTGAGSCGGFLYLEDGIPVRPTGFCNVNQMFEMHLSQGLGEGNPFMETARMWGDMMPRYTQMMMDSMGGANLSEPVEKAMEATFAAWGMPTRSEREGTAASLENVTRQLEQMSKQMADLEKQLADIQKQSSDTGSKEITNE